MFRSDKEGWSDDSLLRSSQSNTLYNINPNSQLHHSSLGVGPGGSRNNSYLNPSMNTPSALSSSLSSPNLQGLGQSRQATPLYGSNGGTTSIGGGSALSSGRLNQFSSGLQNNNSSSLGMSRGMSQPNMSNGFLGHQSNQLSNLNSKFSSSVANSLTTNFGSNSMSSNFGNSLMNSGLFGGGSTSPNMVPSSAGTFATSGSNTINTQGTSHLFGSGLSNNSSAFNNHFNSMSNSNNANNNTYSSFNSTGFSSSLDLQNNATQESLDLSEFPSLQAPAKQLSNLRIDASNSHLSNLSNNSSGPFSMTNATSSGFTKSVTGNKTYSEVSNTNISGQSKQENSPGFQISHEDFPALPGAPKSLPISSQSPIMSNSDIMSLSQPMSQEIKSSGLNMIPNVGMSVMKPTKASIVLPTFPPSMCKDQFGMAGLLAFIRSKDSCPKLIKLVLSIDLCDLGLNLQSKGKLHSTFQSPWADRPCGLHHLEHNVPPEYLTSKRLNFSSSLIHRIKKYGDDLLFWLYYNNIGTTIQLLAIQELQNRGWFYYIPEKIWVTKALGKETPKGPYERGVYCWFDVANWRKCDREMNLDPDKVEYLDKTPAFGL